MTNAPPFYAIISEKGGHFIEKHDNNNMNHDKNGLYSNKQNLPAEQSKSIGVIEGITFPIIIAEFVGLIYFVAINDLYMALASFFSLFLTVGIHGLIIEGIIERKKLRLDSLKRLKWV